MSKLVPLFCVSLIMCCQASDHPATAQQSLKALVEQYMHAASDRNTLSDIIAPLLTVDSVQGHAELVLVNYFTDQLCEAYPYVELDSVRLFVDTMQIRSVTPGSQTLKLDYHACQRTVTDTVTLPTYKPLVWYLDQRDGTFVHKQVP